MRIVPLTLKQANDLVAKLHRHHKPVVGHRFSIGVKGYTGELVGAAIVGRPVSRQIAQYEVAEVTRLVTDGSPNACSVLYGACARIAKEMGFVRIQTYILESEPGTSLKASGWKLDGETSGGNWNHSWRKGRREDQPTVKKQRWAKELHDKKEDAPVCSRCGTSKFVKKFHWDSGATCGPEDPIWTCFKCELPVR